MGFMFLLMIFAATFNSGEGRQKKGSRRESYTRRRHREAWLDQAWFHDHGQTI